MKFKDNEAIYMQIADLVCENILEGKLPTGAKIPSVRDMAIELQVNPNTVMRSYDILQNREIIFNKRGMGLFVSENAQQIIRTDKRQSFLKIRLPELFKEMKLLEISSTELINLYEEYNTNLKPNHNENQ